MEAVVNIGLFLAYILIGVCAISAIVMPLIKAFGDPDSLKKIGLGVGSLAIIFLLAYFLSDGTEMGDASETTVKLVGASITTFYILVTIAVLGIVYTEIKKAFE